MHWITQHCTSYFKVRNLQGLKTVRNNVNEYKYKINRQKSVVHPHPHPLFSPHFYFIRSLKKQNRTRQTVSEHSSVRPELGQLKLKISARLLLTILRSLAVEYTDCPESFSLPLGDTLISFVSEWPGGREPRQSLFPSHEQLGVESRGVAALMARASCRLLGPCWNLRPVTSLAFAACASQANVREWHNRWPSHTQSDDRQGGSGGSVWVYVSLEWG